VTSPLFTPSAWLLERQVADATRRFDADVEQARLRRAARVADADHDADKETDR
jgi:hypothetical protein